MYRKDLMISQRFGTRTVIEEMPERKNGYVLYKIKCDCGDIVILNGSYLRTKNRPCKSCSAKKNTKKGKDHYAYKHGMASRTKGRDRIYAVWIAMRQRCNDPNDASYPSYGGRGIKVCSEWNDFAVFLKDMGERPEGMQIDRINNNGDYCRKNCIWSDRINQANNRRSTTIFQIDGKNVTRKEIQEKLEWTRDQYRRRYEKKGKDWIVNEYKKISILFPI
jgi:hypothetical protein